MRHFPETAVVKLVNNRFPTQLSYYNKTKLYTNTCKKNANYKTVQKQKTLFWILNMHIT